MRPCTPTNHCPAPRESAVKSLRHPAAPVGEPSRIRRHPLAPTPVQQLCTYVQSCDQKRSFLLDRVIAQPLAALPPYGCGIPLAGTARFLFHKMEKKMGGASPLDKPPCGSRHSPGRRNGGPTRIRSKSILEDFRMKTVTIYTDGACSGNPGPGGWGAILMYGPHRRELSGGEAATTNNRMELTAVIQALSLLKEPCIVELWSDSKYVIDALEKGWARSWQAKGWVKSDRKPALNPDLWERLLALCDVHQLRCHWVKGHAENEFNNRCDELAVAESQRHK